MKAEGMGDGEAQGAKVSEGEQKDEQRVSKARDEHEGKIMATT